jgi:glycosyltransferase involved in cell wall biosynthesis
MTGAGQGGPSVRALIPARNEDDLIGQTVKALHGLGIDDVVVVDDASTDATAAAALSSGATVLRIEARAGKGGAVEGALRRLPAADIWLFADADLGRSAEGLAILLDVVRGEADLAVAALPPQTGGGFGLIRRTSSWAIRRLCGFRADQPLSGQRAITGACLAAVRPLAAGFGIETAMTIDAVRSGFTVVEVPVAGLTHRPTGRSLRGFLHRGKQGVDIARAVAGRAVRLR